MSALKQEAVKIIEDMQEDAMVQVIAYLRNILNKEKTSSKSLDGYHTLQSFAGILSADFDYEKELEDARNEKYDRFN